MEQSAVVEALHQKIRELMRDGAHEPELRYAMHTVSAEIQNRSITAAEPEPAAEETEEPTRSTRRTRHV